MVKKVLSVVVVLLLIGWKLFQEWDTHQIAEPDGSIARMSAGQFEKDFTPVKTRGAGLELLKNCQLITGRNSDGDSFHVKHEKGENQFRLYFVDAPESEYKEYGGGENNGERLDDQGGYFNDLDRGGAALIGKDAKAFVLTLLNEKPFQVLTKWEDVVRPGREYCFVIVDWEEREVYLHELLVAQGLARIHTRGADLPGGRNWREQKDFLKRWEKKVRAAGIGAWGF